MQSPLVDHGSVNMNSSKVEAMNKKLTFLLRGWCPKSSSAPPPAFRPNDQRVAWSNLLGRLGQMWNRLGATDVIHTLPSAQTCRVQVFIAERNGKIFIDRIRAIQGHSSDLPTDDQNLDLGNSAPGHIRPRCDLGAFSFFLCPATGLDGHLLAKFEDIPKMAFHAAKPCVASSQEVYRRTEVLSGLSPCFLPCAELDES